VGLGRFGDLAPLINGPLAPVVQQGNHRTKVGIAFGRGVCYGLNERILEQAAARPAPGLLRAGGGSSAVRSARRSASKSSRPWCLVRCLAVVAA
jgi:hypothetical protein